MRLQPSGGPSEGLDAAAAFDAELRRSSDVVELTGFTAAVDATVVRMGLADAEAVAQVLAERLAPLGAVGIGVAVNRWVASVASGVGGVVVVPAVDTERFLRPQPAALLPAAGRLASAGIRTLGEVADRTPAQLEPLLGSRAANVWRMAHGESRRRVRPDGPTLAQGCVGDDVQALAFQVATDLGDRGQVASVLQLVALRSGASPVVRTLRPPTPSNDADVFRDALRAPRGTVALRLVARELSTPSGHTQLGLF